MAELKGITMVKSGLINKILNFTAFIIYILYMLPLIIITSSLSLYLWSKDRVEDMIEDYKYEKSQKLKQKKNGSIK